jgi:ketosteroid isomerase-like protein
MKKLITLLVFLCFKNIFAQQQQVQEAVNALHKAMVDADSVKLRKLTATKLMYVHSGGALDDQNIFVTKITSGKSDFVSIDITDVQIVTEGKTAAIRFTFKAATNDGGKPAEVNLRIMQTWYKHKGNWILLARHAIKII